MMRTVNSIKSVDAKFDSLVNMFIFLFSSVDFLLFLLLATVEVASHEDVGVLLHAGEVGGVDVLSLAHESHLLQTKLLDELLEGAHLDLLAGSIDCVQPNPHCVANYIYNIFDQFFIKSFFNNQFRSMLQRTLCNLIKITARGRGFAFSTQKPETKKDGNPNPNPNAETPENKEEKQRGDEEDFDDEAPLQKQNRNTVGWWIYRFFFWGSFSILSYNIYLVYGHNKKTRVEDEPGAVPYFIDAAKTVVDHINDMTEFITQPPSKKLLVDPVHPDFHPKTLVLNLTGTLVKSDYIFGKGTKIIVRPGLEQFLNRLATKYEIIIFAEQDSAFIMNSLNHVDPRHRYIGNVFGKESMVWRGGSYIKDLKYLNRDLKKIVVVDRLKENVKNQPENVIILPEFDGSNDDHQLNKLVTLLERLSAPDIVDVRKELSRLGENPADSYYEHIKEKQKKLQKKSEVFGLFGGNSNKKGQKPANDDL